MSLNGHSLDQLARVRRLLQRFTTPHPGVRLITFDVESHVALLEPELSVLDPAPFGGLSAVDASDETSDYAESRSKRSSGAPVASTEAARRERRHVMLKASKTPKTPSKFPRAVYRPTPVYPPLAAARAGSSKRDDLDEISHNTQQAASASNDEIVPSQRTDTNRLSTEGSHNEGKRSEESGLRPLKPGEDKVELNTLVQKAMRKRPQPRNAEATVRESNSELAGSPTLPARARLHDAKVIQQRPMPASVVLPVSTLGLSASRNKAMVLTQHPVRSDITGLGSAPGAANKTDIEPGQPHSVARPTFFFNALEPRDDDESDQGLTDRIDQVLREQARRQGVDLT